MLQSQLLRLRGPARARRRDLSARVLRRAAGHGRRPTATMSARSSAPATPAPIRAHNRYNIAPEELIKIQRQARKLGLDIVGFYHSHPDHPAQWSQTDFAEAHWVGCSYVITRVDRAKPPSPTRSC